MTSALEGVPKKQTKGREMRDCDSGRGGRKSGNFADVI